MMEAGVSKMGVLCGHGSDVFWAVLQLLLQQGEGKTGFLLGKEDIDTR